MFVMHSKFFRFFFGSVLKFPFESAFSGIYKWMMNGLASIDEKAQEPSMMIDSISVVFVFVFETGGNLFCFISC